MSPNNYSPFESVITRLRFPLIVGIIVIHCCLVPFEHTEKDVQFICQPSHDIQLFLSQIVARICVPLFFLISGFLFFYKKKIHDFSFFKNQWHKRIFSLLIPYILWNIFALLIVLAKCYGPLSELFPRLSANPLNFMDCIQAFWSFRPEESLNIYEPATGPINTPLWYIRDLMMMCLVSPLIYYILKQKYSLIIPLALTGLFILGIWIPNLTGFSLTSVTFFVIGAWFAIKKIDPVIALTTHCKIQLLLILSAFCYLVIAFLELKNYYEDSWIYFHGIAIIIGVILVITITAFVNQQSKKTIRTVFGAETFFIFGFHYPILGLIKPLISKYISLQHNTVSLFCYFGLIILTVVLSIYTYKIVKHIFPKFTNYLVGSR